MNPRIHLAILALTASLTTAPAQSTWQFPIEPSRVLNSEIKYDGVTAAVGNLQVSAGVATWTVSVGTSPSIQVATFTVDGTSSNDLVATLQSNANGSHVFEWGIMFDLKATFPGDASAAPVVLLDAVSTAATSTFPKTTGSCWYYSGANPPLEAVSKYYPYNFSVAAPTTLPACPSDGDDVSGRASIANNLVAPGFIYTNDSHDKKYYAKDTVELTRMTVQRLSNKVRLTFPYSVWENTGGFDTTNEQVAMGFQQTQVMTIRAEDSIYQLFNHRIAAKNPINKPRITTFYYAGFSSGSNPVLQQVKDFAARISGQYDIVIVRTLQAQPDTADLRCITESFRRLGISPYLYIYSGAIRRPSTGVPAALENYILKTIDGTYYTAPFPDTLTGTGLVAPWLLFDLSQAKARKYLVDIAKQAVSRKADVFATDPDYSPHSVTYPGWGFDGIYVDSPDFFIDRNGRVGGDPTANEPGRTSWHAARIQFFKDLKTAIVAENPSARIGMLGNSFSDGQHIADWSLKENYGANFNSYGDCVHPVEANPLERICTNYAGKNVPFKDRYRIYIEDPSVTSGNHGSLVMGQNGLNPLIVGTALDLWAEADGSWNEGPWYMSMGQIGSDGSLSWDYSMKAMARLMDDAGFYSRSSFVPVATLSQAGVADPRIVSYGPSVVAAGWPKLDIGSAPVSPSDLKITFAGGEVRPMIKLNSDALASAPTETVQLTMPANELTLNSASVSPTKNPDFPTTVDSRIPYIVAERYGLNWYWSGYGFAYKSQFYYVYGDVYFIENPAGGPSSTMRFAVQISPGILTPGVTAPNYLAAHNNTFAARTMYCKFQNPPIAARAFWQDASAVLHDATLAITTASGVSKITLPVTDNPFQAFTVYLGFSGGPAIPTSTTLQDTTPFWWATTSCPGFTTTP